MALQDKELIEEWKRNLSPEIMKHIRKIYLFGSRSLGNYTPESDLDMAIVIDKESPTLKQELENSLYDLMWKLDFNPIISEKIFSEKKFQLALQKGYSFYLHIQQHGILL